MTTNQQLNYQSPLLLPHKTLGHIHLKHAKWVNFAGIGNYSRNAIDFGISHAQWDGMMNKEINCTHCIFHRRSFACQSEKWFIVWKATKCTEK